MLEETTATMANRLTNELMTALHCKVNFEPRRRRVCVTEKVKFAYKTQSEHGAYERRRIKII